MAIPVQCGSCGANHHVQDDMAGKQARCNCGSVLTIPATNFAAPAAPVAAAGQINLNCPGCGAGHAVAASMTGQQARCTCGSVLSIPAAGAAAPQDDIWSDTIGGIGGASAAGDEYQMAPAEPNPLGNSQFSEANASVRSRPRSPEPSHRIRAA